MSSLISVGSPNSTEFMLTERYLVNSCIYKLVSSVVNVASLISISASFQIRSLLQYQSYSAVSIKSSIFELTNSKIRFSAVFFPARNFSKAWSTTGPDAVVDDLASKSSVCNSVHAISKCSKLVRIWTIWPGYWELNRLISAWHTFSHKSSSKDYRNN